jgi:hypothetical protein
MQIKPGITADGFRIAVRDYRPSTVVEELAANAYDADATTCVVLVDFQKLKIYIIDNGIGFNAAAIEGLAILGSGNKREVPVSLAKRHYLGSYGFGLKSTLNIATKLRVQSVSHEGNFTTEIDWADLDRALTPEFAGYPVEKHATRGKATTGTAITLSLKQALDNRDLEDFGRALSNLPSDDGHFVCYFGSYSDVVRDLKVDLSDVKNLPRTCARLARKGKLKTARDSNLTDLEDCEAITVSDKLDKSVQTTIFFAGMEGDNVRPLKPGLRGIYVRIHGRLLKQSFTDSKYTYHISKWKKFESGVRVEISIDWLRNEITLSREGVRFSNQKLEDDFKGALTRALTAFIQPRLKHLLRKRGRALAKQDRQRVELAKKRVSRDRGVIVDCVKSGFDFVPECDSELALLMARQEVISKIHPSYRLIDYNDQASYDCLVWDGSRKALIRTELEPDLIAFLSHKVRDGIELVVTWTRGKWRIGARKGMKAESFELIANEQKKRGQYGLLEYPTKSSKNPRSRYRVVVLEELLK